jgi:transposase-like protein
MLVPIEIQCPRCQGTKIVRNGKKSNGPQNYQCKDCGRQFIDDHEKTYRGCLSGITALIRIALVRGSGVRDTAAILQISVNKVLKTLASRVYALQPKQTHYDTLEINEFWTYGGKQKTKKWLIYASER